MAHLPVGDRAKIYGLQVINRGELRHIDHALKRYARPDPSEQPHYNGGGHSAGQNYGANRLIKKNTAGIKPGYNRSLVQPPKPRLPVVEVTRHIA